MRNPLKILALIIGLIVVLLMGIAAQPPAGRPKVSVRFLSYTNDTTGNRLALFAVSNMGASAVLRAPYYEIQTLTPEGWMVQSGGLLPKGTQIKAGSSEILAFPPATNQSPWRVWIRFFPDAGLAGKFKRGASMTLMLVGLPTRYRVKWYMIESDRIEGRR